MARAVRDSASMFAAPVVERSERPDGSLLLRARQPLEPYARCTGEYLERWAREAPERAFLMQRSAGGTWQGLTYESALEQMQRVAAWLLQQRLSAERPVAILSENSVEHGLLTLACLHIGVPVAPISPAYSLSSKDFSKLKATFEVVRPGLIYAADAARFGAALAAVRHLHSARLVVAAGSTPSDVAVGFDELTAARDSRQVERAFAEVSPATIAKLMFTSGSADEPKAVIVTQRMLCSNQQAIAQLWPFLADPPVLVDWLPWHHTFGGNHNFNLNLRNGGTLYIDDGRPLPGAPFERTLQNLREVAPTLVFNVPRAFGLLVSALQADLALREKFFSRLRLLFYAAAGLPQHVWEALQRLAADTLGRAVPIVSSWGLTETAPAATSCHYQAQCSGVVGLPIPGSELKLVPTADKFEARVRGPNVTPGYWKRQQLTEEGFDEEGFLKTGDAMRFVDPHHPELGLVFDGRLGEDFKLSTGTWVSVGALRLKAIAVLDPVAQDVVVTGHDRDEIGLLIFPDLEACRKLCAEQRTDALPEILDSAPVRQRVQSGLGELERTGTGSSTHATRALFVLEPPSVDAGEITDKGYINQRAVLTRRAALVERLYRNPIDPGVIALSVRTGGDDLGLRQRQPPEIR
jgi:feruloyl-CoA synthase